MQSQVINAGNSTVPLSVALDTTYSSVNGTILTAPDPNAFNFRNNQTAVVPRPLNLTAPVAGNGSFVWNVPAYSITVLQVDV